MSTPIEPPASPVTATDADTQLHLWEGNITWREVPHLREELFDALDGADESLRLDVRHVTGIDRTGVALLIGANLRATSLRRPLTIIDDGTPPRASPIRAFPS